MLTNGVRDVLPFLAAMWLGEALWLTLAVAGLSAFARTFATGLIVLKLLGVAYLLFLAWKMWTAPTATGDDDLPCGQLPWRMFVAGMPVTLGNPNVRQNTFTFHYSKRYPAMVGALPRNHAA